MSVQKGNSNGSATPAAEPATTKTAKKSKSVQGNGKTNGKSPGRSNGSNGSPRHTSNTLPYELDHVDQRELLRVLDEVLNGNFSVRMPIDQVGVSGKICDSLNRIITLNQNMMDEFTKAGNTIGKQGKLTQRIELPQGWKYNR
jgi:hypothetical protein